jgi:guanine deaminase
MQEAYKVARFHDQSLRSFETYYWHTLGNARVMKTDADTGSFAAGKWADFVVLRDRADDPVSALRMQHVETLEQRLFAYQFFAPSVETWTRGVQRT